MEESGVEILEEFFLPDSVRGLIEVESVTTNNNNTNVVLENNEIRTSNTDTHIYTLISNEEETDHSELYNVVVNNWKMTVQVFHKLIGKNDPIFCYFQ